MTIARHKTMDVPGVGTCVVCEILRPREALFLILQMLALCALSLAAAGSAVLLEVRTFGTHFVPAVLGVFAMSYYFFLLPRVRARFEGTTRERSALRAATRAVA